MPDFLKLVALCLLVLSLGCGEKRPDPRANPDFDEEAFNDPSVMPGVKPGESMLKRN